MEDHLIISNEKHPDINNQFVLENLPINIFKLIEKINIEFLKLKVLLQFAELLLMTFPYLFRDTLL